MKYAEMLELHAEIRAAESDPQEQWPVVLNGVEPTQRFLIVSMDPSAGTDKTRGEDKPHSGFEARVISLFEHGDDEPASVDEVLTHYPASRQRFVDAFHWTHYSKRHAPTGNPGTYWAKKYLDREVELAEPELIITFGGLAANYLLRRKAPLGQLVNQVLETPQGIPLIACLHPSRDWNLRRRDDFSFYQTWQLIRARTGYINE